MKMSMVSSTTLGQTDIEKYEAIVLISKQLTRFQVHQDGTGHVAATGGFVEVHVDALQLQVGVAVVGARRVNAVLVADHFPELRADLVAALATLRRVVKKRQ